MTAGTFRLGSLRVLEGGKLAIPLKAFAGFGRKMYYRLTGQIDKSDVEGSELSGVIKLDGDRKATILIEFLDDKKKEGSEKVRVEISTDNTFKDASRQLIPYNQNSYFSRVLDAPTNNIDLITGIQDPNGNLGPKAGNFTLGLLSTTKASKYGTYFAEFKSNLSSIKLFGDTNENGEFDKDDKSLGVLIVFKTKDFGEFREGVGRTFEYKQDTGIFSLKYGGQTYLEASGSSNLF